MKIPRCLTIGLVLFAALPAFGQQSSAAPEAPGAAERRLTKFDLDFPGGTPGELVAAIQKAMGRPLNAIVPPESSDRKLPAFKISGANVVQLFGAMRQASHAMHTALNPGGGDNNVSYVQVQFGFQTEDPRPSDDSVWYFHVDDGATPTLPIVCRFYLLTPYLQRGLTVDDITTAIQTGWKLLGSSPSPTISFHKETNLLIAVGQARQLETIDAVLKALGEPKPPGSKAASKEEMP
jgi:hypothetical protein